MRRCPPRLPGSLKAACLVAGSLRAACLVAGSAGFFAGSLLPAMAPVSSRALLSASTWVCRDQVLACAARRGARSAVDVSPLRIAALSAGAEAAGCGLLLAKAVPAPPKRLPNRSQPPPAAGGLLGSWLRAVAGADAAGPSLQGGARSLPRGSLPAVADATTSPPWPSPAS